MPKDRPKVNLLWCTYHRESDLCCPASFPYSQHLFPFYDSSQKKYDPTPTNTFETSPPTSHPRTQTWVFCRSLTSTARPFEGVRPQETSIVSFILVEPFHSHSFLHWILVLRLFLVVYSLLVPFGECVPLFDPLELPLHSGLVVSDFYHCSLSNHWNHSP